jgi:ABC-2 type transport system permease protein
VRKFIAVVKREYIQRVRTKMFILVTLLAPLVISLFGIAPALIFSIKGGPVRIAVVDETGKLYGHLYNALMNGEGDAEDSTNPTDNIQNTKPGEGLKEVAKSRRTDFELEEIKPGGRSLSQIRSELDRRLQAKELDGYLLLPADVLHDGKSQFFGRNAGDVFTRSLLQKALSRAVRDERLVEANINVKTLQELSKPVELQGVKIGVSGEERDSGEAFLLVFAVGFVMYLTILMYGQVILGAVIEEKETRIAEILFSSVKPFTLMMGKLVGVALVALTQLAIWGVAFGAFALYGVGLLASKGLPIHIPNIPAINFVYFALFFLLGYFVYSTIYALVGSMVTTAQEGGQLSMPIILLLVVGFYLFYPVIKSPDSTFAFWVSMFPFFSPITMLVRIVTQTPPFWQIALSLLIGFGSVVLITWFSSRIYRMGMLMYGKRASIPEAWRWVRQS